MADEKPDFSKPLPTDSKCMGQSLGSAMSDAASAVAHPFAKGLAFIADVVAG